jgi:gliding motility-associated-like protein
VLKNEESFCASENATINNLTNRATNSNTINWYLTPNGTTPLPNTEKLINGTIYYGASYINSPIFCESYPRTLVKVNIETPSKPDGNANQFFCNTSQSKVRDLVITSGINIKWYDNNNTLLDNDIELVNGGKYYATQTIGICESVEKFEVTVSILSPATPTTNANTQLFCIEQNPTLNSITITKSNPLSNIKWFDSLVGGNALPNDTVLLNGNSYYAVEESINPIVCQSDKRLKIDVIIESAATPIVSSIEAPTCAKTTGSVILSGLPNGNWEIIPSSGVSVLGTGGTYKFENLSAGVSYNFKVKTANQCLSQATTEVIIPVVPLYPNSGTITVTQPTCNLPHGKIEFSQQSGMEYSIGGNYQTNPIFDNLQPGIYKTSIRNSTSITCMISTNEVVINPIPKNIDFELKSYCLQNEFMVEIIPLDGSFSLNQVEITWIDKNQNSVGNDPKLNVTRTIGAIDDSIYPLEYTVKVKNTAIGCETSQTITLSSIFCDIQKGISPDGNGSNEYFDLSTFSVKNISIFNRYGVEVYHKKNYKNEWRGQTNDGTSLPDGTYYYIITFNDETSKTGWIYVTKK